MLLSALLVNATSQKRDLQIRTKRSFWPFTSGGGGGGGAAPAGGSGSSNSDAGNSQAGLGDEEEAVLTDENGELIDAPTFRQETVVPANSLVSGRQYPDASLIGPILSQGKIINNEKHYPIYRVHKYNGIHLQPIPVSLVPSDQIQQIVESPGFTQVSDEQLQNHLLPQQPTSDRTGYPDDIVRLAKQFGVTDLSKFPSIEEAMNLLGTTTREETIEAIKEFASTEDGRALIRQFISGNSDDSDNEVAASQTQENVEESEEDAENVENEVNVENRENGDNIEGAETTMIGSMFLNANGVPIGPLLGQSIPGLTGYVQTEQESEQEGDEESTDPNSGVLNRITQWVNFLNPLTNREEIPIPPNEAVSDDSTIIRNNANTIPIPNLPELPPLPSIPGAHHLNVPELPNIHIPARSNVPLFYLKENKPNSNGAYVRVKLPLSGFNPTPQIPVDPRYLNQYARHVSVLPAYQHVSLLPQSRTVLKTLPVSVTQAVKFPNAPAAVYKTPIPAVPHQVYLAPRQASNGLQLPVIQPAIIPFRQTSAASLAQNAIVSPNQQLPQSHKKIIFKTPAYTHIGQLPLIQDANYEVFKNAPQIKTSYGTPALPYTYSLDESINSFRPSPASSAAFIHQEFDLRPAESEVIERSQPQDSNQTNDDHEVIAERANHDSAIADNNEADDFVAHQNHNYEHFESIVPSQKSNKEEEDETAVVGDETGDAFKLNDVVEATVQQHTNLASNIQRITPYNTFATGKVHKADPKAIEMLPFTVRHMLDDEKTVDQH